MPATLLTALVLAIVHVVAGATAALGLKWGPRALSAASGVSVAYVFLDLVPDLGEQQSLIERVGLFPGLERHIYILALVGLTVSLWVETASRESRRRDDHEHPAPRASRHRPVRRRRRLRRSGHSLRRAAAFPVAGRLTPCV